MKLDEKKYVESTIKNFWLLIWEIDKTSQRELYDREVEMARAIEYEYIKFYGTDAYLEFYLPIHLKHIRIEASRVQLKDQLESMMREVKTIKKKITPNIFKRTYERIKKTFITPD